MEQRRVKDAANQPNLYSVVSVDMYALGNNHLKFTPEGNTRLVIKPRTKSKEQVTQLLKNNPNSKPAELQSDCILSALCEQ